MGFGQLPPCLFFVDKIKPREAVNSGLEFNKILQFERSLPVEIIKEWNCQSFSSSSFNTWWQESHQHLFCSAVSSYCSILEPDFQANPKVLSFACSSLTHYHLSLERFLTQFISLDLVESTPPTVAYKTWCPYPRLGWNAPSMRTIMKRKATDALEHQPLSTYKRSASKKPKSKAKKTLLPQADEQQLKSLADAAIEVPSSLPRFSFYHHIN
jgi:RNA recognition motif-containing protein